MTQRQFSLDTLRELAREINDANDKRLATIAGLIATGGVIAAPVDPFLMPDNARPILYMPRNIYDRAIAMIKSADSAIKP